MPFTKQSLTVSQVLKVKTREVHQKSENYLIPYLTAIRSTGDYAVILKMFYGFFHPVEQLIGKQLSRQVLSDIEERGNARLILTDLETIGDQTIPVLCKALPAIHSLPQALGAMYVLEGSTLGGRMIAGMLMKQALFNASNLNFFNGYKEDTGKKWSDLQSVLDRHHQDSSAIINAANNSFECFTTWMQQTLNYETK